MAVYFQNTLVRTSEYVKVSDRYSSMQSVWRGKNRGKIAAMLIGGMQFLTTTPDHVARLYGVADWQGVSVIATHQLPPALAPLSSISKNVGVGQAIILEWALFGRLDVYWIGGTFFASLALAKQVAAVSPKR